MNTSTRIDTKQILRLDTYNVPDIYDTIVHLSEYGRKKILFAPYGPKTMSLAMCLFASQTSSAVYYTQPTIYDPYYSTGKGKCYGFLIKKDGCSLYQV